MLITPATFFKEAGSVVSTTDLVSFWKLDESSGTRYDAFGSNDLTDNNTVGQGTGTVYTNAADFESSNSEYLSIADASQSGLDITGDLTISFWVKFESTPTTGNVWGIVSKYDSNPSTNASYLFDIYNNGGTLEFRFVVSSDGTAGGISVVTSTTTPTTGVWYHVVGGHDDTANEIFISVDDETPATTAFSNTIYNSAAPFAIGAAEYGVGLRYHDGLIGPVGIWSRVLSSAEITALADASDTFYNQF